ncbi:hypothetical protein D3C86_1408850 [compost metagenome]
MPSNVCTRFGLIASFNKAVIARTAPICEANIGCCFVSYPIKIFSRRSCKLDKLSDKHKIAIISDAVVI